MFNEIIAVLSLAITTITAIFLYKSAKGLLTKRPEWIRDTIEEFVAPNEDGVSALDAMGARLGTSIKMGLLGQKSGDARRAKMVEKRVFDAAMTNSPELKIGMKVLEKLGLEDLATPEDLPHLLQLANKYGIFNLAQGTDLKKFTGGSNTPQW